MILSMYRGAWLDFKNFKAFRTRVMHARGGQIVLLLVCIWISHLHCFLHVAFLWCISFSILLCWHEWQTCFARELHQFLWRKKIIILPACGATNIHGAWACRKSSTQYVSIPGREYLHASMPYHDVDESPWDFHVDHVHHSWAGSTIGSMCSAETARMLTTRVLVSRNRLVSRFRMEGIGSMHSFRGTSFCVRHFSLHLEHLHIP